jgi:RHS repeat-associated protein
MVGLDQVLALLLLVRLCRTRRLLRSRLLLMGVAVSMGILLASACGSTPIPPNPPRPSESEGSTPANVSSSGAYQTDFPITVPPYHGLEPNLRLTYNSQRGNGWLGVGWSLAGLSSIQRVSSGRGTPQYDNSDIFLLDGVELIPCTPGMQSPSCLYQASSAHKAYTTKIESYRRIALDPSTPGGYWYVWDKTGTKRTYEPRPYDVTHGVFAWILVSVEDTLGNKVAYHYSYDSSATDLGEDYLDQITYNGTVVKFFSEIRPDFITYATGGNLVTVRYRLKTIDITVGGSRARAYALNYVKTASSRSALHQVQQYGSDAVLDSSKKVTGGTALPAVATFVSDTTLSQVGQWSPERTTQPAWGPPWPDNGGTVGQKNFNDASNLDWNLVWGTQRWFPGDINGDGRADFMRVSLDQTLGPSNPPFYALQVAQSNNDGSFTYFSQVTGWVWSHLVTSDIFRAFSGDVNGDGKSDFVIIAPNSNNPSEIWVRTAISNGDGTFDLRPIQVLPVTAWDPQRRWFVSDANGDGKSDVLFADPEHVCDTWAASHVGCTKGDVFLHAHLFVGFSEGNGKYDFSDPQETDWSFIEWDDPHWFVGDADGDGKSDFMRIVDHPPDTAQPTDPHAAFQIAYSNGDGTFRLQTFDTRIPWETFKIPIPYVDQPRGTDIAQVGDFNGDGKTDFLFVTFTLKKPTDRIATQIVIRTAIQNDAGTYDVLSYKSNLDAKLSNFWNYAKGQGTNFATRWFTGDFNGDGATDLAITAPHDVDHWPTTVNIIKLLSDKKGGFEELPAESTNWFSDCYRNPDQGIGTSPGGETDPCENDLMFTTFAADIDGDNKSDIMYAGFRVPSGGIPRTNLRTIMSGSTGLDTFRWMPADVNGDQREDLIYVYPMSSGVRVHTLLKNANGGYSTASQEHFLNLTNPADRNNLTYPVARNWRVMDVGGPKGTPDGKADLVYISTFSTGPNQIGTLISTLISKGDGTWDEKTPDDKTSLHIPDSLNWMTIDANGDGREDLIHLSRTPTQMIVDALLSNGDGTWTTVNWPLNTANTDAASVATDSRNWRTSDVNGDQRGDLVYMQPLSPNGIRVITLLSNGNGTWGNPVSRDPWPGFNQSDSMNWRTMDVNSDGLQDFVHIAYEAPGIRIHTLLSKGNGNWEKQEQTAWKVSYSTSSDVINWRPADINGDGRIDLVHLRPWGSKIRIESLMSLGTGHWVEEGPDFQQIQGLSSVSSVLWHLADVDGDTKTDLIRIDYQHPGLQITTLSSNAPLDPMLQVQNETGGLTQISYLPAHTSPPSDPKDLSHLPVGAHFMTVDKVTVMDGRFSSSEVQTFTYTLPSWSYTLHGFLSWQTVTVNHSSTNGRVPFVTSTTYQTHEQGIVQPTFTAQRDIVGRTWSYSLFIYPNPGTTPPYRSVLAGVFTYECNLTNICMQNHKDFTYDEFGNIAQILEYGSGLPEEQRTTRIGYFPATAPYIVGLPAYRVVYEGLGTLGRQARSTGFCYDGDDSCNAAPTKGLLTLVKVFNDHLGYSHWTSYEYDTYGNVKKTIDPNLNETTTSYDPMYHLYPITKCNALNQCSSLEWDYPLGRIRKTTDANGQSTTLSYDPLGRLTKTIFPDGGVFQRTYLNTGDPTQQRIREWVNDGSPDGLWAETYIDSLGRVYRTLEEGEKAGITFAQDTQYVGASSQVFRVSHWYQSGSGTPVYEVFRYDGANRPIQQTHPDKSSQTWDYGNDAHQSWTTYRDEEGHEKTTYFDTYGRVIQVREKNNGQYTFTHYTYDVVDNLTEMKDANGNVTTLTWDSAGNNLSTTDLDRGHWTYEYDEDGNLISQTDARKLTTKFTYDKLNRIKTKVYGRRTITWNYDEPGHGAGLGRLTSVRDTLEAHCPGNRSEESTYDVMGQVTVHNQCIEGITYKMVSSYDQLDRLKTLTYPDGEVVTYGYNLAGRLQSVSGYVNSMSYDAAGRLTGAEFANQTKTTFTYDTNRQWLIASTVSRGGNSLYQASYQYKSNGLVQSTSSSTDKMNQSYIYDDLNRLTNVSGDFAQTFSYDAIGNMTSNSAVGVYIYQSNPLIKCGTISPTSCPHAVKRTVIGGLTQEFTYDDNGNMINATRSKASGRIDRSIEWNADNQPIRIQDFKGIWTNVRYDAAGQRVYRERAGEVTQYYGLYIDLSYSKSGGILRKTQYYYAGSLLIAQKSESGKYWYHQDQLGSTRLITDHTGSVVARYDYNTFGTAMNASGTGTTDRQFTGHRTDDANNLIYMNARYYDSDLGRFISADSIIPSMFDPQALNPYSYVTNNPINYTDPTGHQECEGETCSLDVVDNGNTAPVMHIDKPLTISGRVPKLSAPPLVEAEFGDLSEWSPWSGNHPLSPPPLVNAEASVTDLGGLWPADSKHAFGFQIDLGAQGCGIACFLLGGTDFGVYFTPPESNDRFFHDFHLFVTGGFSVLGLTRAPDKKIDYLEPDPFLSGIGKGWQSSLGLAAGIGVSIQGFVTEAATPNDFSEWARQGSLSLGPANAGLAKNLSGQRTLVFGLGTSEGWVAAGSVYNTYTRFW